MRFEENDGCTLLEIMVVVLIIGMLMALITPSIWRRFDVAKRQMARMGVTQLTSELELYKLDNGGYPTGDQGLVALVREPASEPRAGHYPAGGYAKSDSLIDPWKNPYNYDRPGRYNPSTFDVYSFADDGQPGGDGANADIGNYSAPTRQSQCAEK